MQQINELRALVDLALLLHGRAPSSALADALQDAEVAVARALATATAALMTPRAPALVLATPQKGDRVLVAGRVSAVDMSTSPFRAAVEVAHDTVRIYTDDEVFVDPRESQP